MGGIVSAKEGAKPKVTTTAATQPHQFLLQHTILHRIWHVNWSFKNCAHNYAAEKVITLVGCKFKKTMHLALIKNDLFGACRWILL